MIDLIHGDCLEEMKRFPDNSIDLVLTDPPYGTTACKWDTVIPFEPMWEQLHRVAKKNAAICLFGSEPFSSALRMSNIKNFKYDWVWLKDKGSNIGNSKREPLRKSEIISVFYDSLPQYDWRGEKLDKPLTRVLPNKTSETGGLQGSKSMGKSERKTTTYTHKTKNNVLYFKRETQYSKGFHPTQKPVALLEYLIKTYTLEGETVLDFAMGSGSTGVASMNLNRNFIGIEKEKKYFEIAQKRIEECRTT